MKDWIEKILRWVLRISPYVFEVLKPWLQRQEEVLWRVGLPRATAIVRELAEDSNLPGLDKHKAAVEALHAEMVQSLRVQADDLSKSDIGAIVLQAYEAWRAATDDDAKEGAK